MKTRRTKRCVSFFCFTAKTPRSQRIL